MYDVERQIAKTATMSKKSLILNDRIHCEHFYFCPVYRQLFFKRNLLLNSVSKSGVIRENLIPTLPSLRMKVVYHRRLH